MEIKQEQMYSHPTNEKQNCKNVQVLLKGGKLHVKSPLMQQGWPLWKNCLKHLPYDRLPFRN
jgi:hypothetical protein